MTQVHGLGPVYVLRHRKRPVRPLTFASMREIDPPYRWGRGIEVRLFGRTYGVGVCRRRVFENDYIAIREALAGKDMTVEPEKIGDWHG